MSRIKEVPNWVENYRWRCPGCGTNGPLGQSQKEAEDDGKAHVKACKWKSIMLVEIHYLLAWYDDAQSYAQNIMMNKLIKRVWKLGDKLRKEAHAQGLSDKDLVLVTTHIQQGQPPTYEMEKVTGSPSQWLYDRYLSKKKKR